MWLLRGRKVAVAQAEAEQVRPAAVQLGVDRGVDLDLAQLLGIRLARRMGGVAGASIGICWDKMALRSHFNPYHLTPRRALTPAPGYQSLLSEEVFPPFDSLD